MPDVQLSAAGGHLVLRLPVDELHDRLLSRADRTERRSFIRYATFVSLFPQLVAGPIERASNLLPQLRRAPRDPPRRTWPTDLSLFVVGLFKKVALADYLALYVDPIYAAPGDYQAPALLLATFAFAWQIYFDFSGYTDMARGIGRMMGIRLMLNFNNPYLATGLGDFWRRWHISLSTWFRDYVYIPLGRQSPRRTANLREHGPDHGDLGPVARCHVDLRAVGAVHAAGRVADAMRWSRRPSTAIVCRCWPNRFSLSRWSCWRGCSSVPRASRTPG